MKHFGIKMLLVCLIAGFGIFFGVDLATRGIDRINGPLPDTAAAQGKHPAAASAVQGAATVAAGPAGSKAASGGARTGAGANTAGGVKAAAGKAVAPPVQEAVLHTSFINRLTNRTGDALRRLAEFAMDLVTSFCQSLLG